MDFDFRFRNAHGKWESVGHRKGADRVAALEGLIERTPGGLPPGRYMSRPRSRQKDWDLFSLDGDGEIRTPEEELAPERPSTLVQDQWLR
jgi:hypothetical protein